MKKYSTLIITVVIIALLIGVWLVKSRPSIVTGSVIRGSEYQSTTTSSNSPFQVPANLKTGPGALGQITIPGSGTGYIVLIDATTTDITQRNFVATSSILLASFGPTLTAGTYVFDTIFVNGLSMWSSGSYSTTTITWH